MIGYRVNSISMQRGILVVDTAIGEEDDVVLAGRVEHGVVVNVVIVALDHQSTSSVPNDVVVHGSIATFSRLPNRCIKASTVLDDIVNPVVGDFSTWCFALHHLDNCTIGLQITNIPHFVVEDLGRITNGENRRCTGEVNVVVCEIHITSTFVNGGHQTLLISC